MKSLQEDLGTFEARFFRCRRLLHHLACGVLGGPERADHAVQKCWLTASRNLPQFDYEGAFRSWLVRVLIDEALVILREDRNQNGQMLRDDDSPQGQFDHSGTSTL